MKSYDHYRPGQAAELIPFINFIPEWFIDCGPGTGREAHVFKQAYPNISILGIEASPDCCNLITADYPGTLLNYAVADVPGLITLDNPHKILHSSIVRSSSVEYSINIEKTTIDRLCQEFGPFSNAILWADIEGAEILALTGAAETIKRGAIRLLNLEVGGKEDEDTMDRFCEELGFKKVHSYCFNSYHHDNVYEYQQ